MARKSTKDKLSEARMAAQVARAEALTEKVRFETARLKGEYVSKAEVELDAAQTATAVITALEQIPNRVAGMCEGADEDTIARILRSEIERTVEVLHQSQFIH